MKKRKSLCMLPFRCFSLQGAWWDSNPRHSEPQSDVSIPLLSFCLSVFPETAKRRFSEILRKEVQITVVFWSSSWSR